MTSKEVMTSEEAPERVVTGQTMLAALVATLLLEVITLVARYGLRLDSTRDTASTIGRLTFGLRIHHGYVGAALLLAAYGLSQTHPRGSRLVFIAGASLLASDAVHHFLILWPIEGTPQFDLWYHAP
ncbi:MAG: hypothetical protein AAGD07_03700 [Planctomycetota bacterium]